MAYGTYTHTHTWDKYKWHIIYSTFFLKYIRNVSEVFLFPNISKDSQCYHAKMPIFVPSSNINCNFLLFFSQFPKGLKCQNLFFPLCCLTLVCFRTARTRMAVATPEELCMAVIAPDVDLAQCVTGAVVVDHPGGPLDRGGGRKCFFVCMFCIF